MYDSLPFLSKREYETQKKTSSRWGALGNFKKFSVQYYRANLGDSWIRGSYSELRDQIHNIRSGNPIFSSCLIKMIDTRCSCDIVVSPNIIKKNK